MTNTGNAATTASRPVEVTEHGSIICSGAEGVAIYMKLSILHSLSLEVATGLGNSRRVSVLQQANYLSAQLNTEYIYEKTGVRLPGFAQKRTKAGALLDLVMFLALTEGYEPSPTIAKSLGDKLAPAMRKVAKIISKLEPVEG